MDTFMLRCQDGEMRRVCIYCRQPVEYGSDGECCPPEVNSMRNPVPAGYRSCHACGCWEFDPCVHVDGGPCWWVSDDLCSRCAALPGAIA